MNFTATTFPSSSLRSLLIPRWLSDFGSSVTPLSPSHASAVRQGFITGRKDAGGVRSHRPNILTFILLAIPLLLLCRNVLSSNIGVIMILQFLGLSLSLYLIFIRFLFLFRCLTALPSKRLGELRWGTRHLSLTEILPTFVSLSCHSAKFTVTTGQKILKVID